MGNLEKCLMTLLRPILGLVAWVTIAGIVVIAIIHRINRINKKKKNGK